MNSIVRYLFALFVIALMTHDRAVNAQATRDTKPDAAQSETAFREHIQPLLKKHCLRCHNAENAESGVRVDQLTWSVEDRHQKLLTRMLEQLSEQSMPPDDEPQPSAEDRKSLADWIERSLAAARARPTPRNGSIRRLTVAQYRNTLKDLLGLVEDLTDALPPDGVSKDGFTNQEQTMTLSPLQVEAYFDIAERALDASIVDENRRPVVQSFRMEIGTKINPEPCPDKLILGANSELLDNADFLVTEPQLPKSFEFKPFHMRTAYDFIEGYEGNDTVRGWRKFDSIYHSVFACVRGTPGYPKGQAYEVVDCGLLLRPAIPSPEIFGQSNTYGPMANFKISLRELPDEGNFRVTVQAARYDDGLLLDADAKPFGDGSAITADLVNSRDTAVTIHEPGIYQIDVYHLPINDIDNSRDKDKDKKHVFTLTLGDRQLSGQLVASKTTGDSPADRSTAFAIVRLPAGELKLTARHVNRQLKRIAFSRVSSDSELGRRFVAFEQRAPLLGVHLGLRRDCGSTLTQVGDAQVVASNDLRTYVFEGAIRDFPSPDVERDNVNYLAGIREIGVRCEYTDGRDMPRLLVRSIEFEGPFYASWPPAAHRRIFIESAHRETPATYAREILGSFATRAFRRPVTPGELEGIIAVWQAAFDQGRDFPQCIKDALLVVLTSPQFLFVIETSNGPEAENLDSYELASKLSYLLWNTPPDERLLQLAAQNALHAALDAEFERMIRDARFGQFAQEFTSQWLGLEKFDVVAVDADRYPRLSRDAKTQLRQEPVYYVRYLIEQNLPLSKLVQSDFVMANEVVANYYDLADHANSGFRFVPIQHENANLGGLLTHAAILAGLSDGREANPVKRGAWLARKLIAEPPDDPPPNVPQIRDDDGTMLTLRQKLERHRNQEGCAKCHAGIDPWGIPFEQFDAAGRFSSDPKIDPRSTLPDGTDIEDLNALKAYLANRRIDQVAFSFLKHLATYAAGRSLTYNELVFLREEGIRLRPTGYRMQDMLRLVVHSDLFLKK